MVVGTSRKAGKQVKATPKSALAAKSKSKPSRPTAKSGVKATKVQAPSSSSGSESGSDHSEDEDDRSAMLAALEAHSRSMFGLESPAESSAQAAARGSSSEPDSAEEDEDFDDEFDDGWGQGDAFVTDSEDELGFDNMAKTVKNGKVKAKPAPEKHVSTNPAKAPVEVVFADTPGRGSTILSKAERRAFLNGNSAKMMGLKPEEVPGRGKRKRGNEEDEEEQNNTRLDKSLHDMLLTSLLPGAAQDAASRPVDKRAAMSGRLLELANYSLPGEGEHVVRGSNLSSHPAKVRTGLLHAKQRRAESARAEAEAAGSWVKGKGGLGDIGRKGAGLRPGKEREVRTFGTTTKKKGMDGKKNERAKGLAMGVGKFNNGALRISEGEIARVNNAGKGGKRKGMGKKGMRGW